MVRLLSISISVISTLLVLLPAMLISRNIIFKHTQIQFLFILIYAAYLSAVFTVVGIPALNAIEVNGECNLIPFIDILNSPREYIINVVLNIILFIPLGFFIPALWEEWHSLKKVTVIGLELSLMIEILQIFTFRLTDIDDLIANTFGTMVGYFCFSKLPEHYGSKFSISGAKYEPFTICAIVFVLMISIHPLISDAIWNVVLSSSLWERIR